MKARKLLRIAYWEVTKNAGGIDRRTLAVAVVSIAVLGLLAPTVVTGGSGLDDGIYRVGVDEASPYYDVVASDDTFVVRPADRGAFEDGSIDLLIEGVDIRHAQTSKGRAAHAELRASIQRYNDRQMRQDPNGTAAFPVTVTLEFRPQAGVGDTVGIEDPDQDTGESETGGTDTGGSDGTDDPTGDDSGSDTVDSGDTGEDGTEQTTPDSDEDGSDQTTADGGDGSDLNGDEGATTGDGQVESDAGDEQTTDDEVAEDGTGEDDDTGPLADLAAPLSEDGVSGSPSDIEPPFPFQSLVLAFLFVIPLNFIIQAYGSTILSERLNRRGELLLVSPVSRLDIIGGKTLPYFVGAMAIEGTIAMGLVYLVRGSIGGIVSILAVTPLVALFLGATFLGAMFARSFKELTFVTVTITVTLTTYAFVPAIFTEVGPIALISPLTLVVRDLQSEAVTLSEFAFSTTPPLLSALVCFGLGAGLYREEDMFDQRSVPGKVIDALAGPIPRSGHRRRGKTVADHIPITNLRQYAGVAGLTIALIPIVFVVQLLAVAMLFALGEISIVLILIVVAFVEEVAKSLHVYAGYEHRRFDGGLPIAFVIGVASGIGFFIGEKLALLAQLVGLPELQIGEAALQGAVPTGPILLLFLLAPLLLHTVTAGISALGASRGKRSYVLAVGLAMIVHFVYNWLVVMTVA